MTDIVTKYEHGVTLIGGGPVTDRCLSRCLARAPVLIAADGGADRAAALGQVPRLIVGDLDSLVNQQTWRDSGIQILECVEQETTDFEKCLSAVTADFYLCTGFIGGRLDHELVALNALLAYRDRTILLVGDEDICFLCPNALAIDLPEGTRLSLVPLVEVAGTASAGLAWPVDGLTMAPGGRIGTSNRVTGPVKLSFDHHGVLVILPVCHLAAAMAALGVSEGDTVHRDH